MGWTGRALAAFERFRECLKVLNTQGDTEEVVFTLQEALGHSAAVSRFFWPVSDDKLAVARSKNLRAAFALDEDDPLFRVRLVRNRMSISMSDLIASAPASPSVRSSILLSLITGWSIKRLRMSLDLSMPKLRS
jgi:hypothetical protein